MPERELRDSATQISVESQRRIDSLCNEFERAFRGGENPLIEDYLERLREPLRPHLLRELLGIELQLRSEKGSPIDVGDYHRRFPANANVVDEEIRRAGNGDINQRASTPQNIGRFEIRKVLGEGAFGCVYLAYDPQTDRLVALKVPSEKLFKSGVSVESFLAEARNAGRLEHPGLVTVHDVQTEGDQPYIVQEYIDGCNLGAWLQEQKPTNADIVRVLVEIVEAVGFAHQQRLYHRDLKPANVLIDRQGHAHVADFGLAIHENVQKERKGEISGSPAYMSPEQVRATTTAPRSC